MWASSFPGKDYLHLKSSGAKKKRKKKRKGINQVFYIFYTFRISGTVTFAGLADPKETANSRR